ncbi:hypothetical protein HDV00_005699 [Rhizophlyctis rosea]|nr:hypothetical protein HDV00_005699 [Rhizophlyctis rosea]
MGVYPPPSTPPPPTHNTSVDATSDRTKSLGALSLLTDEIIFEEIFSQFDVEALRTLCATSRLLRHFASDVQLWRQKCLQRCAAEKVEGGVIYKGSWQVTYHFPGDLEGTPVGQKRRVELGQKVFSYTQNPPYYLSPFLYSRWCRSNMDLSAFIPDSMSDSIPHIPGNHLTAETFQKEYESQSQPVMVGKTQIVDHWSAFKNWSIDVLKEKYGDVHFRVGNEYGNPRNVDISFAAYVDYMRAQEDEAPLYVFDKAFGEKAPDMLKDYGVPHIFQDDLLSLLTTKRPSYRWLVLGPARSGASWHIDPHGTSAWNTLISGRKRWALYPPHIIPPGVSTHPSSTSPLTPDFTSPPPLFWFLEIYPTIPVEDRPLEIVQEAGETIFVPAGWWHTVLNIGAENVAVTQNWCGKWNLEGVVAEMCGANRDGGVVHAFKEGIRKEYPHLLPVVEKTISLHGPTSDDVIRREGFTSRYEFMNSFSSPDVWFPRVRNAVWECCGEVTFGAGDVDPIGNGVNPVYRVRLGDAVEVPSPVRMSRKRRRGDGEVDGEEREMIVKELGVAVRTQTLIVKFYTHFGDGLTAWASEVRALEVLGGGGRGCCAGISTILGIGNLRNGDDEEGWKWPWIVMVNPESVGHDGEEAEEGVMRQQPVGEVLGRLSSESRDDLVRWLADQLSYIHSAVPPTSTKANAGTSRHVRSTADFAYLLVDGLRNYGMRTKGRFPEILYRKLGSYLPGSVEEVLDCVSREGAGWGVRILHGDMTAGNVLGDVVGASLVDGAETDWMDEDDDHNDIEATTTPQSISWHPTLLIDFGDSFHCTSTPSTLDPLFDIACMHVSLFRCDKTRLQAFMQRYLVLRGVEGSEELWREWRKRMMWYLILWRFEGVGGGFSKWVSMEVQRTGGGEEVGWEDVEGWVFGEWWG